MLLAIVGATMFMGKKSTNDKGPLAVKMISLTHDEGDAWSIRAAIYNQSDKVYGVPIVTAVMRDDKGKVVGRQKFSPEVPLLAPSERAEFSHRIIISSPQVRKVGLEFEKVAE
jgi:hypothetical protein